MQKKGPFLQMRCTDMYHFIASFGLFEKAEASRLSSNIDLAPPQWNYYEQTKTLNIWVWPFHLNIAVLEMIMSYDDDSYDKLTCVWEVT